MKRFEIYFIMIYINFFLYKYPYQSIDYINYHYKSYIERIEKFANSESNKEIRDLGKLYKYILGFLDACPGDDYTIILDQYKSDLSDIDYLGLNSIIRFIINHKDNLKIKLIISSSVDNTSNKYILLKNLSNIYLNLNTSNLSKLLLEETLIILIYIIMKIFFQQAIKKLK